MNAKPRADTPLQLQDGGTLNPRRHLYVKRPEDAVLLERLRAGEYTNILTSRQMGKSSLMIRAAEALVGEGRRYVIVDLAAELGTPTDAETYFLGLLTKIHRDLRLKINLRTWWDGQPGSTINQRLMALFRDVVCTEIADPVVVFLDEIDSTLKLPYTDDLFTAIRGMHNERPHVPDYERLTFCLIGVAWPNELIKDRRTTPYNVGSTLELRDFDLGRDDLTPLIDVLGADSKQGQWLLERVLYWTGGHPYLTIRLCKSLVKMGADAPEDVDRYVDDSFRSLARVSGDAHFQQVLRFLETRIADGLTTFSLYENILRSVRERDQTTPAHMELKLSGLVKRDVEGYLVVRNRMYEQIFNLDWLLRTPVGTQQLPADLGDFAGREWETAELEALLSGDGAAAAITAIGGMGGIGKSALAVHVGHRLVDRYPDGQLVIDMGGTSDQPLEPATAMERVIHSFEPGARLPDEPDAVAALYRSLLSDKRALIILDNASDGAQVRPLMPPPPCAAIVTSRRGIALDGVRSFNLDALSESEARGLLVAILGPDRVGEAELAGLASACGRLPLALRVAGAFLNLHRDWTADEYLAALADERERLRRLRIEGDEALDVLASLGLSVAQLAREQADLAARWRMLAVFAGDFKSAAAAAVWDVPSAEARDGLSALVGRSMVLFDGDAARYRLHDLIRDVALGADLAEADLAALAPIEERAAARHAEHYLAVLGSADDLYLRGDDGITAGLALFDLEWRNIEAGQDWAARTAPDDDTAARACGEYPIRGIYVLGLRLHARARIGWLEASVGAARRLQDRAMEGAALGNLGNAYRDLGETRRAIEFYKHRIEIAREIGYRRGEGAALGNLGIAYLELGETRRAIEFYEQRLEIACEIGDRRSEGAALGNLGLAYAALGETRRAIKFYEQQLEITREIGDRRGEGNALGSLGIAYLELGETRRAIEFYEQQLEIAREIGDRRGEGNALGNLGNSSAALGETRGAIEFYEQQLEITREIGDRRGEGISLYNLGDELAKAGERGQAITRLQEALEIFEEIEAPFADRARAALERLKSDD